MKDVFSWSSISIRIWLSIKLRSSCPTVTSTSMLNGNESLGHALFRSAKSIKTHHFSFFFRITTTLSCHCRCCTSRMDPMSINFWISLLMIWFRSEANCRLFCLTGRLSRSTCRWCTTTFGSIYVISSCDHVKKSWFVLRKYMIWSHNVLLSRAPIWTLCSGKSGRIGTSLISSILGFSVRTSFW